MSRQKPDAQTPSAPRRVRHGARRSSLRLRATPGAGPRAPERCAAPARPRPAAADGSSGTPLLLATYNVHRCIGRDGRHDPGRVAAVIRQLGADVVALQEVSSRTPRHGVHQLEYLAEHTGLTPVSGPTLRSHQGDYGNALLTRLEVRGVSRFDLSVRGREPRGLLDVRLGAFGSTLRVCATHLGLGRGERREQVRRLLEHLARPHPDPLVLLGDMNEWLPVRGTLHRVHQQLGPGRGARSFPARLPLLRLDRIWAQPHQALQAPRVHATPLAREASDHLPVLAAFRRGDADGAEAAIALGGT